jgi:hypothetical protein
MIRDGQGEYIMTVNGKSFPIHPWVGVQLDEWTQTPRDWSNENFTRNPNDDVRDLRNRFVGHRSNNFIIKVKNDQGKYVPVDGLKSGKISMNAATLNVPTVK